MGNLAYAQGVDEAYEHYFDYQNYQVILNNTNLIRAKGSVVQVVGLVLEALLQGVEIGELCFIRSADRKRTYPCEVVGFRARRVLLMPLANLEGIGAGAEVIATGKQVSVKCGPGLLGRVLDGLGNPIDGKGPIVAEKYYALLRLLPGALAW